MAKSESINWNADWDNWENQSYTIIWRWIISRAKLVKEVKQWKHEWVSIYKRNDLDYVRGLPDNSESNNIDK